jgi:hypothetical protein
MPDYIVCRKKRNNPRMDVRICEMKCSEKEACPEFKGHHKSTSDSANASPEVVDLKAA